MSNKVIDIAEFIQRNEPIDITEYDTLIDDLVEIYHVHNDPYSVQAVVNLLPRDQQILLGERVWELVAEQEREEMKRKKVKNK